mgnify:CR=1 FL=1
MIIYPLNTLFSSTPLSCAMVYGSLNLLSASKVAFTTLCGLELPFDLANTSFTPADSKTALIAPPAITPVPFQAGLIKILPPLYLPSC